MLSIIVNNFNYAAYLSEAIDSALAQTVEAKEIIIVDDGSTDQSRAVIEKYGQQVRAVFKQNGGQASAFNAGFAASKGEWVMFLDADDVLYPNAATEALAATTEPDFSYAAVQFMMQVVNADRVSVEPPRTMPLFQFQGDPVASMLKCGKYKFSPTSGNLFRRETLAKVLPMPEEAFRVCADAYIQTALPFFGKICFLDKILGDYRVHQKNNHWQKSGPKSIDSLTQGAFYRAQKLKVIRELAAAKDLPLDPYFEVHDATEVYKEWRCRRLYTGSRFQFDPAARGSALWRFAKATFHNVNGRSRWSNLKLFLATAFVMIAPRPFLKLC
jgi:glycosyltransferase involved in cell wall biosynthesis